MNTPIPTPVSPGTPATPGRVSPSEVEPGTQPTAPQDPPDTLPGIEPRTEPDDRAGDDAPFLESHPGARLATQALGATVGAIGGALAGGVLGIAAGPVGSLAGAAAGAALGGMAGSGAGVDDGQAGSAWADEGYWREAFTSRPYVREGTRYEDWAPAYRYGAEAYVRHAPMCTWSEAQPRLGLGWNDARGDSPLAWDEARHAAQDAWERMKHNAAGKL